MTVRQPERGVPEEKIRALVGMQQMPSEGKTTVAVNLSGCLIPVSFSIYLLTHTALGASEVLIAVVTVALVAYLCSRPLRGVGVAMPLLVPPVTAAVIAVLLDYEQRAPLPTSAERWACSWVPICFASEISEVWAYRWRRSVEPGRLTAYSSPAW